MGSPSDQGKQKKQGEQKPGDQSSEARDTRMKGDAEKNKQAGKQGEPKGSQKSPSDPAKTLGKGSKSDNPNAKPPQRPDDVPGWHIGLPPEIRDAIDAGRSEDIPDRYKALVRRYNLWLQKHRRERK